MTSLYQRQQEAAKAKKDLPKYRVFRKEIQFFRDIEHTIPAPSKFTYGVFKVHYDIRKKTMIYARNPSPGMDYQENVDDLKKELTLMMDAFDHPVLDYKTFEEIKESPNEEVGSVVPSEG